MRKYISFFTIALSFSMAQAQDVNDGLRYAQDNTTGTARYRSMSGAFGALGGDLSAINVNPAGSSVFANNQVTLTLSGGGINNDSDYFGKKSNDSQNSFDLNQAGGVFVFTNSSDYSNWKKFAIGVNYENINNFNNKIFVAGTNPTNSIGKYFEYYANAIPSLGISTIPLNTIKNGFYEDLSFADQQAFLGYQSYVIDPVNPDPNGPNLTYQSNIPLGGNYIQQNAIVTSGNNGKVSFNLSSQYRDLLIIGINLNSHFTDYRRSSRFYESNNNPKNASPKRTINKVNFNNDLYTYGSGFSFQIGTIFKPTKELRLGVAYQSPVWYSLNDEFSQNISVSGYGLQEVNFPNIPNTNIASESSYNPEITNVYEPYKIRTPGKWTGSFAYIFAKKGLISFDYSIKDYSNTSFTPEKDFTFLNQEVKRNTRKSTSEYRAGAEYRIKQFSLRGGYHFEQSPYKNNTTIGNLTSFSGGIGYNFGSTKLDLAYVNSKRESNQSFFSAGFTDGAKINSINNNIIVTLAFEL
jgi:hypothetical protein